MAIKGDFFSVKREWSFIPWLALSVVRSKIHLYPDDWKNLPIPDIALAQQQPIVDLVDRILAAKTAAPAADISALEAEIDRLVSALYGSTGEPACSLAPEIAIIDSLSFEAGRTVEMTKIVLNDYMPLYRVLANKKYAYNPKLLRQLKRDIYQLVATNQPSSAFRVVDIEDDAQLENVEIVVGVGVGKTPAQTNNRSHHVPDISDLFRDILFDDGQFDLQSLVESALAPLLNSHSGSLPIHKYVACYRKRFLQEPPLVVLKCCSGTYDDFLNKTLLKRRWQRAPDSPTSIDAILANTLDVKRQIEAAVLLSETEMDAAQLKSFLIKVWTSDPAIFFTQGVSSDFRRLVKIFDWLTYGKKEEPSCDGSSKTLNAPTT